MGNAFSFKSYYNPNISPTTNSFWGVVSIAANEAPQQASQDTIISLICDVSGSMQGAKFNSMIETVENLLLTAPNDISLNIVVFDNNAHEVLPLTRIQANTDRNGLVQAFRKTIKRLAIFGGTSMSTGILQALAAQNLARGSVARYGIFLTDGQNTEPEAQLAAAVKKAADLQMHLCAYGYGNDWDPKQLTKMAEITQGWQPKAVPNPSDLQKEFSALVARMAKTVATDVVLQLWTPAGAKILSLSQAYPQWVKGEAAPTGDNHTWVVPVPPMSSKDHRDFIVHLELASVGAKVVACRPSVVYVSNGQKIEEKGEQDTWVILQQTTDASLYNQVNPVVAGYLGQGQLAESTRAMTAALDAGDRQGAERHRTEALEIAQASGNKQMTQVLEDAAQSDVARKTAALGTATVSLTEEDDK
ncbi:MAG: vWA domain-containing protein [Aggregatilineales bacterium]